MSSFVMDQPTLKPRKGMLHGSSSTFVVDVRAGGNVAGLFGYRSPPVYSSLPSFAATKQPPLLPLPFSTSATLPSPNRRVAAAAAAAGPGATGRARQHKKKARSSRKETRSLADTARSSPKPVGEAAVEMKVEESGGEGDEVFLGRWVYSISPPPSSLPLPRFSLMRPRTNVVAAAAPNCKAEAVAGGGGGVAAGASDDLRRLLRI